MPDGVGWAACEGLFLFVSKALDTRVSRRQKRSQKYSSFTDSFTDIEKTWFFPRETSRLLTGQSQGK